jgi:hypothetical protein
MLGKKNMSENDLLAKIAAAGLVGRGRRRFSSAFERQRIKSVVSPKKICAL